MQTLPPALAGFAKFPQFILYKLVPSASRPGKTDKFPVDPRTGKVATAHDPGAWCSFEHAAACVAAGMGDGVGYVFTEADPFWFLDIDGALDASGQWSEIARYLIAAFPGAAVEVSSSGKGLHIFGSGTVPAHGCKHLGYGLEFYTSGRFVALTGTHATGSVNADMTAVMPWLVEHFFPLTGGQDKPTDWTTEAREDWRGPTDDEDLLRRALQSKSVGAVFGGKASFADLWDANVAVLAQAYPDPAREYDASSADAALAAHLAFWTGCNMERMLALMNRSALKRDKWNREDYLTKFTIPNACKAGRQVLQDKPAAEAPAPALGSPARIREGETHLSPQAQVDYFAGCVYVSNDHRILVPGGAMLRPDQFKTAYAGRIFALDDGNEKTTRNAWEAFTESTVNVCPAAAFAQFRPDLPPGTITEDEGRAFVNSYYPIPIKRKAGSVEPFMQHLRLLLPVERDRDILLAYMAACVQHIGVKFQWAPLLQGAEGNGKTLFSRCVEAALGERYTHWPRADQISAKFNAWQEGKLFIAVEDVYLPDDRGEVIEIIKPMITNTRLSIERKGVDQLTAAICCNWILNSNHKDAIRKTRGDRRFAQFYTAQQTVGDLKLAGMEGDYFPRLYRWLREGEGYAIVSDFLYSYAIPAELNPATECQRSPETSSTEEAIRASIGGIEQEVLEAIQSGTPGFMGGWVSTHALGRLLDKLGRSRVLTHRKREQMLADLGYVKHAGLDGGRVNNPVLPDTTKPVLFVKAGSLQSQLTNPSEIARAYTAAQGLDVGGGRGQSAGAIFGNS